MVLHEVGYLIIGGVFQCWFWDSSSPCPNADKIKPAGIVREKAGDFETREVHYEETGFTIFSKKEDTLEIRKKTGEKVFVRLSDLNRQVQAVLPKTTPSDDIKQSLWRYESLEEILKGSMINHEIDYLSLLRKDDLKTPLVISKEQIEAIRQKRIDLALKEHQLSLPIGSIVASVPCTYKKIDINTTSGTCAALKEAPAYAKPDRNSEKVIQATLSWAHLQGRMINQTQPTPKERLEELLVFEEQGDWVQMKLVVLDKSKRIVWLNKKDIPYKIVQLNQADRLKTLIDFLQASAPAEVVENLKSLSKKPVRLDLDSAGETKWSEGILWVKVNVRSEPHCTASDGESHSLSTGWLPYFDPKSKQKVLSWFSRGC